MQLLEVASVLVVDIQELEESKKSEEQLKGELVSVTEKFTRAQATIKAARGRIQMLTQEKEQVMEERRWG